LSRPLWLVLPSSDAGLRTHIGPHFLNISQTLLLCAALPRIPPARTILASRRPNRIPLFVVHHHFVDGCIFVFVQAHISLLKLMPRRRIISPPLSRFQIHLPDRQYSMLSGTAASSAGMFVHTSSCASADRAPPTHRDQSRCESGDRGLASN